jgi:hypothetical protein
MGQMFVKMTGSFPLTLALMGLVLVGGCNHGPKMVQVKGTVHNKDGSVPKAGVAVVRFEPTLDSKAEIRKGASGSIQSDGSFEVWTRKPGDGIYVGQYDVTFAIQKGVMDSTPMVQPMYTSKATTPYKNITIDQDKSDFKFQVEPLTGAGG